MKKFLGKENIFDDVRNSFGVVIPIPFEFSTSYGKGAGNGPDAIFTASEYVELYDEYLRCETYKHGILTAPELDCNKNTVEVFSQITSVIEKYLNENKFVIGLGGEHSITQAIYKAFDERYEEISILQFDAHADLRDEYENNKYSHASVMRRIWEMNQNIVQCGIRSLSAEEAQFIEENKISTFFAYDLKKKNDWDEILERLKKNVFITIDVDFFDPSVVPATGTPEPGGFFWDESMMFLEKIFKNRNVVGCDVVELSPVKDLHYADFLVAKLVYKLFGFKIQNI